MSSQRKDIGVYTAELNRALCKQLGLKSSREIPVQYNSLISKTAQDMRMLDRIINELDSADGLTTVEVGSMGQRKMTVNPLIPYYEKMSARVTDDLYNLGLTSRKQAAKGESIADRKAQDALQGYMSATIG